MSKYPTKQSVITDQLLQSWIRCRRKAWLDSFGNNDMKILTAHQQLLSAHTKISLMEFIGESKAGIGLRDCLKGKLNVLGVNLKGNTPKGQLIEAKPPLLIKSKGKSIFGEYSYEPVVVRQGRRITRENKLTLALNGILLKEIQHAPVRKGIVISKENDGITIEHINLNGNLNKKLFESLIKMEADLSKEKEPPLTSDRKKCVLCSWQKLCDIEAKKSGHLSEVDGVGAKRLKILEEIGIKSISHLANAKPLELEIEMSKYGPQHEGVSNKIINQAISLECGTIEKIYSGRILTELDLANGILIYDIESDPDEGHDFLHGFLRLTRNKEGKFNIKNSIYNPLLIESKCNDLFAWERIYKKINKYPNWPIIHFGETEFLTISKMAKKQGVSEEKINGIKSRMIDLHTIVRRSWILPVKNYGLKTIANWTGFHWSQEDAYGASALLWWKQFEGKSCNNQEKLKLLSKIFTYNNEDCIATWKVAEWLLNQDKKI